VTGSAPIKTPFEPIESDSARRPPKSIVADATSKKGKMAEEASAAPLPSVQRWRLWRGPPELAILGSGGPPPPELAGQVVPPLKTAPVEESRDDFEEKEAAKIEAR
jgi:hypothetical protein